MSAFGDNSFSSDSVEKRLNRLQAIQEHHAMTIPLMSGLHEDIKTWMQDCFTAYRQARLSLGLGEGGDTSSSISRKEAVRAMNEQLQLAKEHIDANFAKDPARRSEYGLSGVIDRRAAELAALADRVSQVHTAHEEQNVSQRMSDGQITRFRAALSALNASLADRNAAKAKQDKVSTAEEQQFDDDTIMLERLLAAWHNDCGRADERIGYIGMANVQRGGRRGLPGAPTIVIDPHDLALVISPDANRPAPTSYQTEFREANSGLDWDNFASGSETHVPTAVALLNAGTDYEFRTRARNANGYGEWSAIVVRVG